MMAIREFSPAFATELAFSGREMFSRGVGGRVEQSEYHRKGGYSASALQRGHSRETAKLTKGDTCLKVLAASRPGGFQVRTGPLLTMSSSVVIVAYRAFARCARGAESTVPTDDARW
jgi:hypothetical protein